MQTQEAMASRRSHAPTNASRMIMSCGFRGAGPIIMKPTASCEAAQLWVRELSHLSHKCSPKGDLHIPDNVDDSRSRFAEPREGEVMPIPQLRSFGACSGFLMDTCPLGTRR